MAFIHDHPRSSSALAVTITREIHISSERHERNNSMAELMSPGNGALQIEKQKHNRWKANPHPDNIILPRKAPAKKKPPKKNTELDPIDLTRRLNDHLRGLKIRENGGLKPELQEMDWEKLRRQPRIEHSRAASKLEIRKEPYPIREPEKHNYYTGPRPAPALPQNETTAVEAHATDLYAAYRQFSLRTESASTGLYQHSQFKGTPLRKDSDATGTDLYTESLNRTESFDSSETSRTSSRGTGTVDRIKSFQGLPPLLFQQSDEHFNSETTLSLESTFEKLERTLTDTSSISNSTHAMAGTFASSNSAAAISIGDNSVAGTFGRDTFGPKNGDAPIFDTTIFDASEQNKNQLSKKNSTMTNSTITTSNRTTRTTMTDSSGETIQFFMRQSAFPQEPPVPELPELTQQIDQSNIHPLHRLPTATSERDLPPLSAPAPDRDLPRLPPSTSASFASEHSLPPLETRPLLNEEPILTLHEAPSQVPPSPLKGRIPISRFASPSPSTGRDRGRTLQAIHPATSRSLSSDDTHRPIQQEVSYSYWRLSRPESWGPDEQSSTPDDRIDSYYYMDDTKAAATSHMRQPSNLDALDAEKERKMSSVSMPQPPAIKGGVFGLFGKVFGSSTKPKLPREPLGTCLNELHRAVATDAREEKGYNLPGVLPDDFPTQRKNLLGGRPKAVTCGRERERERDKNGLNRAFMTQEDEKGYNLLGVLPDDFPMQRKNFLGTFSSRR